MTSLKNKSIAVLISDAGTGTNLQAIIDGVEKGKINSQICAVISDKIDALGLERARKHNLKIEICPKKEALLSSLQKLNPDYICLAGWKQIILDEVILAFPNRILNLHPGLIPDTIEGSVKNPDGTNALWNKGMLTNKAIQNFLDKKATFAGSSIHFLTLNFDFGPVLGRVFEKVEEHDNIESLYSRLKKKENQLYVEILEKLINQKNNRQKILIIGSGGREHAIGWKIAQSENAGQIFFAPGNAGTTEIGINVDIKATELEKLLEFAQKEKIDLTLALPDDPLALGIVNMFRQAGLLIWGPTKEASRLEWSKAFAKEFMQKHNLPTAKFQIFTDFTKAKAYIDTQPLPIVIKASGLALGKGVTICQNKEEAYKTLEDVMIKKIFGDSGNEVVIEEFLIGPEISIHVLSDGSKNDNKNNQGYKIFPTSQDHKRIGEGDIGPNTGGMGVIAPLSFVNKEMMIRIEKEIIAPTLKAMIEEGSPFEGILYPSLMLTKEGPKIIEFNARFGDPEAQTYMRLLDTDLLQIINSCVDKKLDKQEIKWKNIYACNIALVSGGYPGNYEKGKIISGIDSPLEEYPLGGGGQIIHPGASATPQEGNDNNIVIFHAGTKIQNGNLVTNGGRVLGVSATGNTLEEALQKAYESIQKISFEGMQYRKDIGKKALLLSKQK